MIKDILDNIVLAEKAADAIEKEAAKKAHEIRINANNKAEEYIEASKKATKEEVRKIMLKASADGEAQAAAMIEKNRKAQAALVKASEKNHAEAVCRIIAEFLNSDNL
jgi:vacuolar-type H+-ATPase subunit H